MAYLPFGDGQRVCIGNRLALMQMKLAIARVILKYEICIDSSHHKEAEKLPMENLSQLMFRPAVPPSIYLKEV